METCKVSQDKILYGYKSQSMNVDKGEVGGNARCRGSRPCMTARVRAWKVDKGQMVEFKVPQVKTLYA